MLGVMSRSYFVLLAWALPFALAERVPFSISRVRIYLPLEDAYSRRVMVGKGLHCVGFFFFFVEHQ